MDDKLSRLIPAEDKPKLNVAYKVVLAALSAAAFITQASANPMKEGILRIGGSTTLLPTVSTVASDFMRKFRTWDKVNVSLPKKRVIIFVSGGGSGFGIKSTVNGTVNIGLASRDLKEKEKKLMEEYQTYLVGRDALVFAVNKENPLAAVRRGFTLAEIAELFSGEKRTFNDVDSSLPADGMVLFVRDSGAGSAEMLQKLALKKKKISPEALQLPSQGSLLKKLENNTSGMGYISSGLAFASDKLAIFDLEGITPTNENVINGKYVFIRPLLFVVKGKPDPMTRAFIDYMLDEGQKVIKANHYVPASHSK